MSYKQDSSDDEKYEDALVAVPPTMEVDLEASINETTIAMDLFLNNRFSDALIRMKPHSNKSMYHALGYGTIMYMQAIMTYEPADINTAIESLKVAVQVCQRYRKKLAVGHSLKKIISKPNYDNYTEEQVHAELCYAECLLIRAMLTFIQDENLVNFLKGAMKIRTCYQSYKECLNMLNRRTWDNERLKNHFKSGVKMGVGAFNLLISQLPSRILKLLEFLGFNGNRFVGLKELDEGFSLSKSLRSPLCSTILLAYHTIIAYILGTGDGDVEYAEKILQQMLNTYPKGAIFLYFSGRVQVINGNIEKAIERFEEGIQVQQEWIQFHHICYWELVWCHCYNCNWEMAAKFSELLRVNSKWSKAIFCYQKAAFLCMQDDFQPDIEEITSLMRQIPGLKQRIAGKSLPIEKFAAKKSERFISQNNKLVLPALELVYVWNGFSTLGKQHDLLLSVLREVEKAEKNLDNFQGKYKTDNYCLVLFLKGMCLRLMDSPLQAEQCFSKVHDSEKDLAEDKYLVPFSLLELGLLSMEAGDPETAEILFEKARNDYKGFALEGRLHFRVHSAINKLKSKQQYLSVSTTNPLPTPDPSPASSSAALAEGDTT